MDSPAGRGGFPQILVSTEFILSQENQKVNLRNWMVATKTLFCFLQGSGHIRLWIPKGLESELD